MAAWAADEVTAAQLSRIPLSRCHHQSRRLTHQEAGVSGEYQETRL